jgi:hypothetical protein
MAIRPWPSVASSEPAMTDPQTVPHDDRLPAPRRLNRRVRRRERIGSLAHTSSIRHGRPDGTDRFDSTRTRPIALYGGPPGHG